MEKLIYRLARIKDWQFRLARVERHRDRGSTLAQACTKMRISRSTYWEWCQRVKTLQTGAAG